MRGKKLAAILIIVFALIILIGLIYFMFLASVRPKQPPAAVPAAEEKPAATAAPETVTPAPARKEKVTAEDLQRLAASFVERYGSYSNQSGYANILDLEIFMSRALKRLTLDYIERSRGQNRQTDIYYGLTTKAVVVETKQFDDYAGQAEFIVKTQRKESAGVSANARTFQQDASVVIIKEGGAWKVDKLTWGE